MELLWGLQKGEIYGLKFSDFDLERRSVKISRQIVANPIIKEGSRIEENVSMASRLRRLQIRK